MKLKKINKLLSVVLAATMCLTVVACGQEEAPATQPSESSSAAKESTDASESKVEETKMYWEMLDEVSDTSELPDWTGDTLEINMWYAAGTNAGLDPFSEYPETEVTWKEFERVTGVKINWDECFDNGGQAVDAKLPMVIASGDLPTVIMGYGIDSQMRTLYDEGYLADLSEYYENGELDQVTYWVPTEELSFYYESFTTDDGAVYGIPMGGQGDANKLIPIYEKAGYSVEEYDTVYFNTYASTPGNQAGVTTGQTIWVRDDILTALYPDALTMDEIEAIYMENGTFTEEQIYDIGITSIEEFAELLRDVKELVDTGEYVGKDGKPIEVFYGSHTETDSWYLSVFMPYMLGFGATSDYFSYVDLTAKDPSQVVKRSIDSDKYVDYFRSINELVREGVIAKDSYLDNGTMFNEKVNNHHYAFAYVNTMNGETGEGDGYRYRPLWIDAPISEDTAGTYAVTLNSYFGIFKDSLADEEMDQLIHAINYLNSVVGINNFYWGPESAGLFTEDADGHRTYVDEALYNSMILNEDNGEFRKYGLYGVNTANTVDNMTFRSFGTTLLQPKYLEKGNLGRKESDAYIYYNPGILEGESKAENAVVVSVDATVHGAFGQMNEDIKTFWAARPGFEDQLKKVFAAETEADFEKNLEALRQYADENSLTEETFEQFSKDWVEMNKVDLELAGYSY